MNLTEDQEKFIRSTMKRLGDTMSPEILSHYLKRHFKLSVSLAELSLKMKEFSDKRKPSPGAVLPQDRKHKDIKQTCFEIINEIKQATAKQPATEAPTPNTVGGLSAVLHLSDLHIGEVTKRNNKVIFDLNIAKQDLSNIVDQFINAPELVGYTVDECVVLLVGDIIDGELIFPAQSFETDGHAFEQVRVAVEIIYKLLTRLSEKFPVVNVYCAPGNHGRSSKIHHQMSNWDNVIYFGLQLMSTIDKSSNINVFTPDQMWMDFRVRQWNVHIRHIGVTQASSAGPAKKVINWMNLHNADLFFYGHYHCPEMFSNGLKRIFKNGALPPMNDFAENLGFSEGRGQWMVGISDKDLVAFAKILIPGQD